MKKSPSTAIVPVRPSRPAKTEPVEESTALTVAIRLPKIKGKTPGARINFLHKLSVASGKVSIAAGILAGWELSRARAACDHGQWIAWLKNNTEISDTTARNYMEVYAKTLGAARAALPRPVPAETPPSPKEVEAASANVEAKSLSALYAQLRLLKRSDNHGGAREGAGRKPKAAPGGKEDVASRLDAAANNPELLWATAKSALDTLVQLDADKDFLHRLSDEHLAAVVSCLEPLAEKARKLFADRASWKGVPGAADSDLSAASIQL